MGPSVPILFHALGADTIEVYRAESFEGALELPNGKICIRLGGLSDYMSEIDSDSRRTRQFMPTTVKFWAS